VPSDVDGGFDGTSPPVCGTNADCDPGLYCHRLQCANTMGLCTLRPTACGTEVGPVCGCDGRIYRNACEAVLAGVDSDPDRGRCL
jgi:hypothetical protein